MTIDEMKAVLAADYCGDFSEAAKQLNTSRSMLVHSIRNAEEKLGGQLFEKKDARMSHSLTEFGKCIVPCLQEITHTYEEMLENIEKMQELVENRICVGISSSSQENPDTIRMLTDLIRMHPQIEITSLIRQSYTLEQMLFARQVDCAFFTYMNNETPGFDVERILHSDPIETVTVNHAQNMYIAMSARHSMASRESVSLRELRGETFFFNQELRSEVYGKHRVRQFFSNCGEDENDFHIRYLDYINPEFLFDLVADGAGLLPRIHIRPQKGVVFVPLENFTTRYTTIMAAHRLIANPNKHFFLLSAKKLAEEAGHAPGTP